MSPTQQRADEKVFRLSFIFCVFYSCFVLFIFLWSLSWKFPTFNLKDHCKDSPRATGISKGINMMLFQALKEVGEKGFF